MKNKEQEQERALTSKNCGVRSNAVKLDNLTPEQQERALTDKNFNVRAEAVKLNDLTSEQIDLL